MKLLPGAWTVEATRHLNALARLKNEGENGFWTRPQLNAVREAATRAAVSEGKAVHQQHVLIAAGNQSNLVNTRRWVRRMTR